MQGSIEEILNRKISHYRNYDPAFLERMLFKVSKRWIAGYSNNDAVAEASKSNQKGMGAILNYLGEGYIEESDTDMSVKEYLSLLNLLKSKNVRGSISVKPTQIGLSIGYDVCLKNFMEISGKAKQSGHFMWIDIESSNYVEDTLSIYLEVLRKNRNIGVAIQSYLKRSYSDILHLIENSANLRIANAAYSGETDEAYQSNRDISQNFSRLMKVVMKDGIYEGILAVATHDFKLIEEALSLSLSSKGPEKMNNLQFQLLKGIRDELKQQLVKS